MPIKDKELLIITDLAHYVTWRVIGKKYCVSRELIRQVLDKHRGRIDLLRRQFAQEHAEELEQRARQLLEDSSKPGQAGKQGRAFLVALCVALIQAAQEQGADPPAGIAQAAAAAADTQDVDSS